MSAANSSLLGAILVRTAGLSLQALQAALDRQRTSVGVRLGQILLEMDAISEEDLDRALALQREMQHEDLAPKG